MKDAEPLSAFRTASAFCKSPVFCNSSAVIAPPCIAAKFIAGCTGPPAAVLI